jgi:hypothetical protein
MLLLLLILILLFGGFGGSYYGYSNGWGPPNRQPEQGRWIGPGVWGGALPVVVIVLIVLLLAGRL